MVNKKITIGVSILVGIPILLIIVLIPLSLHKLNYDEIGIEYNKLSKKIHGDNVLEEGRHLLSPTSKIFKYTRTLQTIDLTGINSLECLTNEGLRMELGVETQFQIVKENLSNILEEYGEQDNYIPYLESITKDAIRDVCANYSGEDFFFNRGTIDLALSTTLVQEFSDSNAYATNELVQLTSVVHPEEYDQVSRSREAVGQENDRLLRQREQRITEAETTLLSALVDAEIKIINANATRDSIIAEAEALYESEVNKWTARTDALAAIKAGIPGISNMEFINEYVKYYVLSGNNNLPIVQI